MLTSILQTLELLILPPGFVFVLLLIGLLLSRRLPRVSVFINVSALSLLLLLSMPVVARQLLSSLQEYPAIPVSELIKGKSEGVIVILGGGRYSAAPEYGYRDEVSTYTLERLRYGALIAEKLKLPILLSGGRRNENATSEAVIMNQVMVSDFNIDSQFLEINGINTHQQAIEVNKILLEKNINEIYLVTHAWHMKRAINEFRLQGLIVKPAPMGFAATSNAMNEYLPSAFALASSSRALHEYFGLFYLNNFY